MLSRKYDMDMQYLHERMWHPHKKGLQVIVTHSFPLDRNIPLVDLHSLVVGKLSESSRIVGEILSCTYLQLQKPLMQEMK